MESYTKQDINKRIAAKYDKLDFEKTNIWYKNHGQ
jgi:hypothetical protein